MATPRQIAANRANAKKSTGPRTPAGKQRASLNARRHGLTGQVTLMPAEDRAALESFSTEIIASLQPATAMERQLAQSIAADQWRLNRMRAIEDNILALGQTTETIEPNHPEIEAAVTAAGAFLEDPRRFQLITLYIQRTSRELHRNMQLLRQLQNDRRAERAEALEEATRMKEVYTDRGLAFDRQTYPTLVSELTGEKSPIGFEFSNTELESFRFHDRNIRRPGKPRLLSSRAA